MGRKQYRCRVDAASLFSCAGQLSVTPEYNLKNATIFSNAPYVHLESEGEGKKAFGFIRSAFLSGPESGRENTILLWKKLAFISERASVPNPLCEPPRRKGRKKPEV